MCLLVSVCFFIYIFHWDTMYTVYCRMCTVQCTVYSVQCTMYSVQCTWVIAISNVHIDNIGNTNIIIRFIEEQRLIRNGIKKT